MLYPDEYPDIPDRDPRAGGAGGLGAWPRLRGMAPTSDILVPAVVALAFGGGLLPSVISANKQAFSNLADVKVSENVQRDSPPLRIAWLLGYPEPPRVADVLTVLSRLPSTSSESKFLPSESRRLLRKTEFSDALASFPEPRWLVDSASGQPVGGEALKQQLGGTLRTRRPSAVALECCWDALSGGSPYVAREEIGRQVGRWRPAEGELALSAFETSLIQGRASIFLGYAVLFGLQALVLSVLVLGPLADAFPPGGGAQ